MFDPDMPDLTPPPRPPAGLGDIAAACGILALSAVGMGVLVWASWPVSAWIVLGALLTVVVWAWVSL